MLAMDSKINAVWSFGSYSYLLYVNFHPIIKDCQTVKLLNFCMKISQIWMLSWRIFAELPVVTYS